AKERLEERRLEDMAFYCMKGSDRTGPGQERAITYLAKQRKFRNRTIPASQIRNPRFQIGRTTLAHSPFILKCRISGLRFRNRPISKSSRSVLVNQYIAAH